MDYERFKEVVKGRILDYLPNEQDSKVHIIPCQKNNGLELDGMTIIGEQAINPTFYLNFYYEDYLKGKTMDDILKKIAVDFVTAKEQMPQHNYEFDYDKVKDHIYIGVCNAERNQVLLKYAPHELHEDLALVYRIHYKADEASQSYIQVKNSHLELWGIDEQTLKAGAWESMRKEMPMQFEGIAEVLEEIMGGLPFSGLPEGKDPLYILSNQEKFHGASYMFDEEVMEQIAEKLGGNLIIMPSSVHEAIIVKETERLDLQSLKDMVSGINELMVSNEEYLSDEIYRYDAEEHKLSMVEDFGSQQMGMQM